MVLLVAGAASRKPPVEEVVFALFSQTLEVDASIERIVTRTRCRTEIEISFRVRNRFYGVGSLETDYWDLILVC